jgi:hypothetical protein
MDPHPNDDQHSAEQANMVRDPREETENLRRLLDIDLRISDFAGCHGQIPQLVVSGAPGKRRTPEGPDPRLFTVSVGCLVLRIGSERLPVHGASGATTASRIRDTVTAYVFRHATNANQD